MTRQDQKSINMFTLAKALSHQLIGALISTLFISTAIAAANEADKDADAIAELTRPQSKIEIGPA